MDELIKDLKQVILEMQGIVSEVHHNGENCPFCGEDWVDPGPDQPNWVCPDADCIDNKAIAVVNRANEYLEPIRRKDGEETRVPIVQPDGYIEGWWVTDTQD